MTRDALEAIRQIARSQFGYQTLRPGQEAAIQSLLDKRDTLCVLPTGSGKSAIYQLVGLYRRTLTVVVSPIIALQQDQVAALDETAPGTAIEINSTLSDTEREQLLSQLGEPGSRFVFLAPEQLTRPETLDRLAAARPGLFVVDEAHCISEWGQDFRQDFLRLGAAVDALGHPPVLALTATASPPVRHEIVERLHLVEPNVLVDELDRPNIHLAVETFHDDELRIDALLDRIVQARTPGIVYTSTRARSEMLARELQGRKLRAAPYHGGLKASVRVATQADFMDDRLDVIVATTAFGMGVDKANVRFVYHDGLSESLDAYCQEFGRGGRDGEPAVAVLFTTTDDMDLSHFRAGAGQLSIEDVEQVLAQLRLSGGHVNAGRLQANTPIKTSRLHRVLNRLEDIGIVEMEPDGEVKVVDLSRDLAAVEKEVVTRQRHRQHFAQSQLEMLQRYVGDDGCRRAFLLQYFGQSSAERCENCDNCDRRTANGAALPRALEDGFQAGARVRHDTFGDGIITHLDADSLTVLFDSDGYRMLSRDLVLEGKLLEHLSS